VVVEASPCRSRVRCCRFIRQRVHGYLNRGRPEDLLDSRSMQHPSGFVKRKQGVTGSPTSPAWGDNRTPFGRHPPTEASDGVHVRRPGAPPKRPNRLTSEPHPIPAPDALIARRASN
jgi:hypothetical protein